MSGRLRRRATGVTRLSALVLAVCALAASLGAQGQQTDSLIDRAARSIAAGHTLRALFDQTLTNPDTRQVRTSHGEFVQQGPSKFAFRFSDPAGDAIVADGMAIWVYLPSTARGQALKLPIAQGAQLDLLSQLLTNPRVTYKVSEGAQEEIASRAVSVLTLIPKAASAPFTKATLWIDREDASVRQLEAVEPSGLIRRIRFRDIRSDVDLPRDALTFVVPPNVKVIDATALLGGLRPPEIRNKK